MKVEKNIYFIGRFKKNEPWKLPNCLRRPVLEEQQAWLESCWIVTDWEFTQPLQAQGGLCQPPSNRL